MTLQSGSNNSDFIEFMLAENVLKFGEFTLNSGRLSPYFFNMGEVSGGAAFARLGKAYAQAIIQSGLEFDVLFGPAYKGIPIAVATAVALSEHGIDVGVAYNRKEVKDHGEGGRLVGAAVQGRVLLIDDVLTSGKAIRDAVNLIAEAEAQIVGAIIAMDRQELNDQKVTAVTGLSSDLGAPVISIANMADLIEYLVSANDSAENDTLARMRVYQEKYCVSQIATN